MNCFNGLGRICTDIEIKYSQGNTPVAFGSYTIAIDRPKAKDKETVTDFIPCKVVGRTAEFAERYLQKGMKIAIEGRIQTRTYDDKDGKRVYVTEIVVEHHEFCEKKAESSGGYTGNYGQASGGYSAPGSDFAPIEDEDPVLPF
jgi:single-strand DNA-binding protein